MITRWRYRLVPGRQSFVELRHFQACRVHRGEASQLRENRRESFRVADRRRTTGEVTVAAVALPVVDVDPLSRTPKAFASGLLSREQSESNFIAAVRTTAIDAKNNLVGFQGDFTFDERVVTFQSEPVQKAGITGGNWNVSGNILAGPGPIRTLRVSAYSNDSGR